MKACAYQDIGPIPSNFWFEVAMPEQLFPYEKCVIWALVKNIQTLLNSPGSNQGLSSLKSLLEFIQEFSGSRDVVSISNDLGYIQKGLKNAERNSVANLELFIDFLTLANEIIKIDKYDHIISIFQRCVNDWHNFYASLSELVINDSLSASDSKTVRLGARIYETYLLGLNELNETLLNSKIAATI